MVGGLFSDAPVPCTVTAFDDEALVGQSAKLTLSLDALSGQNGDTLHLTITPEAADTFFGGEERAKKMT
jgi:hypothetical protein